MASRSSFNSFTRRGFLSQAARASVGSLAASSILRDLRLIGTASAEGRLDRFLPNDYKALVCIFLAGGNDSDNMIINVNPSTSSPVANYARRGNLAIQTGLNALIPTGGVALPYAFHPSFKRNAAYPWGTYTQEQGIKKLFEEKRAAAIFNVGPLLYPLNGNADLNKPALLPPQLYSHSDQATHWQTSIPDGSNDTGWAGRMADLLLEGVAQEDRGMLALNSSSSGTNTFQMGRNFQFNISPRGAIQLGVLPGTREWTGGWHQALQNIVDIPHPNLLRTAYADAISNAKSTGELVNTALDGTVEIGSKKSTGADGTWQWKIDTPSLKWDSGFPATALGSQLKMVARMIAARGGLGMKRQTFFVQAGGYDTHADQVGVGAPAGGIHAGLLTELSDAVFAFQRAMQQLQIEDKVVSFTASDFGRTFLPNNLGSDHGWGGHHLVFGGLNAINGGAAYGDYPNQAVGSNDDAGHGRWVPKISVDQYSATLAKWFGVGGEDLNTIFPHLHRFGIKDLGFLKTTI